MIKDRKPQKVGDLVFSDCPILDEDASFAEVTASLGRSEVPAVLAVDAAGRLTGIFTSTDLARCLGAKTGRRTRLKSIMIANPRTVTSDTSLHDCAGLIKQGHGRYLPVIEDGRIRGVISIYDIHEVVIDELKEKLTELERLQHDLRQRDDILGMVSHDIRAPLNVISVCCEYLLGGHLAPPTPDQISFLERIKSNSDRAVTLAREILDLMRLEAGGSLQFTRVELGELVRELATNLSLLAARKEITIDCIVPEPVFALVDRKRLTQALENLLTNAIKFTIEKRRIHIKVAHEERGGQGWARISIRDQGMGIREEDVGRLFDKFKQLDTGVAKKLGVGLGLSLAHQFIKAHHGEIEVEGGHGSGATFHTLIPGAALDVAPAPATGALRVLVVDDDSDIREYFAEELADAGYEVITAGDGREGLHKFRQYRPDLVISDIRMPGLDGFELLAAVRTSSHNAPFILCSGVYPQLNDDIARSVFRADDMLEKPVMSDGLVKAVQKIFPQRKAS